MKRVGRRPEEGISFSDFISIIQALPVRWEQVCIARLLAFDDLHHP